MASIRLSNFGDIISVCVNRAKIAGDVQVEDEDFIKGAINETYVTICTERNWRWRKFDRAFVFSEPQSNGTVSVTNASRVISFSAITENNQILMRTLRVDGDDEMYRIVGFDAALGQGYLDAAYVGTTAAAATFNLYEYEFALPPDCDTVVQVYIDGALDNEGQLDELSVLEFNRLLSRTPLEGGVPRYWCRDGDIYINPSLEALDVQVLDYDFLGGDDLDRVERIRLWPIEPDANRIIHLNYGLQVVPMEADADRPIIPVDNRWILVHGALYEWWKTQGNLALADRELKDKERMLKEMRAEFHKGDAKPKMIYDARRNLRHHSIDTNDDLFVISRAREY